MRQISLLFLVRFVLDLLRNNGKGFFFSILFFDKFQWIYLPNTRTHVRLKYTQRITTANLYSINQLIISYHMPAISHKCTLFDTNSFRHQLSCSLCTEHIQLSNINSLSVWYRLMYCRNVLLTEKPRYTGISIKNKNVMFVGSGWRLLWECYAVYICNIYQY